MIGDQWHVERPCVLQELVEASFQSAERGRLIFQAAESFRTADLFDDAAVLEQGGTCLGE